jgi:hypothetical protein
MQKWLGWSGGVAAGLALLTFERLRRSIHHAPVLAEFVDERGHRWVTSTRQTWTRVGLDGKANGFGLNFTSGPDDAQGQVVRGYREGWIT